MRRSLMSRKKKHFARILSLLLTLGGGAGLFFLYLWLYTGVLGQDLPRTVLLKQEHDRWISRVEAIRHDIRQQEDILEGLKLRDETIYRSIFGIGSVPDEVRYSGYSLRSGDRYPELQGSSLLRRTAFDMDGMEKEIYVQSLSLEEIAGIAKEAGDMASCIPTIPPITPDRSTYHMSSPFGYRSDPLNGTHKMHSGMDFACRPGNPIYATGDGVVESLRFEITGWGNSVLIDHGFSYKTRYAHMSIINVVEGMKVRRGDCIGYSGKSGRVSGPHLHYEVYYRGTAVNPAGYMDLDMDLDEYRKLIQTRQEDSRAVLGSPKKRL